MSEKYVSLPAQQSLMATMRSAEPSSGQDHILIPVDPDREAEERIMSEGIILIYSVKDDLISIARELDVEFE